MRPFVIQSIRTTIQGAPKTAIQVLTERTSTSHREAIRKLVREGLTDLVELTSPGSIAPQGYHYKCSLQSIIETQAEKVRNTAFDWSLSYHLRFKVLESKHVIQ